MGVAVALSRIGTVYSMFVLRHFIADYGISATMLAVPSFQLLDLVFPSFGPQETKGLGLRLIYRISGL